MKYDQIDWQKLARYLAGGCSEKEAAEIERWIQSDPEQSRFMDSLKQIWEMSEKASLDLNLDEAWFRFTHNTLLFPEGSRRTKTARLPLSSLLSKIYPMKEHLLWRRSSVAQILRVAAIVVLMVGGAYFSVKLFRGSGVPRQPSMQEIITENGQRAKIRLSDGTRVVLDAASMLRFSSEFTGNVREFHLEGEAYFDVAPDPQRPFVVHAGGSVIRVLGTEFNVGTWEREREVRVVVVRGKVSLRAESSPREEGVVLSMGQMSSFTKEGELTPPRRVDVDRYLAWMRDELVFENTPFREVMIQLERWYDLHCELSDSTLAFRHLTARFKDEPIAEILNIIALSLDIKCEQRDQTVIFSFGGP